MMCLRLWAVVAVVFVFAIVHKAPHVHCPLGGLFHYWIFLHPNLACAGYSATCVCVCVCVCVCLCTCVCVCVCVCVISCECVNLYLHMSLH